MNDDEESARGRVRINRLSISYGQKFSFDGGIDLVNSGSTEDIVVISFAMYSAAEGGSFLEQ